MKECVRCLYTSQHPFGLDFNSEGLCTGCITHDEKFTLDWDKRFKILESRVGEILAVKDRNAQYDCVIPIRGTPEYFYVVDVMKNKLGLKPLVVAYNTQFNSEPGVRNVDLIREVFDVDYVQYTSNPVIYKKLIRETLNKLNSMRWPFLAGYTQFPVQIAAEKGIPLVVWPYHQPTEQAGMHSYTELNEMTRRGRHDFDLMGLEPHELIDVGTLIHPSEVEDIHYPTNSDLKKNNIVGIYLSNYLPWDSRRYSEEMIAKFGASAAKNKRTFDTYDRIDDKTYMTIHDILKQAKLGYSRVTDNLCREIRFKRISKEDARNIERYYQASYPKKEIEFFLKWLGMKYEGFKWYLDYLPHSVNELETDSVTLNDVQKKFIDSFIVNHADVHQTEDYIVYGKGLWV